MKKHFFIFSAFIYLMILLGFVACTQAPADIEVKDFVALSNYSSSSDTLKTISLDYSGAIKDGFIIPTIRQVKDGEFEFVFNVRNNTGSPQKFCYKIYYQNETYKFPEEDPNSSENFYGSWEDPDQKFRFTGDIPSDGEFHPVTSRFRIVGNPRNEKQFYGSDKIEPLTEEEIQNTINGIKNTPEWLKMIVDKAKNNGMSFDEQMRLDAVYTINEARSNGNSNNRWKRNPRVGEYSFLLVVSHPNNIETKAIPDYIQNISIENDSNFVSPYAFFLNGPGKSLEQNVVMRSKDKLKVIAKPQLGNGIFVDAADFGNNTFNTTAYSSNCSGNTSLFYKADFKQFIHSYNPHFTFENIPKVADVAGGEYTKADYINNKYPATAAVKTPISITKCPCKTVHSDSANNKITLHVPGVVEGEFRKENVGIISRHGLTYGKFRVKAKLPELLNRDNLWNGLTNAVWMIYQQGGWNKRRVCSKNGGYVPKSYSGDGIKDKPNKNPRDVYSEIDIEIVKASRNWPLSSYGGDKSKKPIDPVSDSDKVMITYTNWDLACQDPKNFDRGVHYLEHNNTKYELHRWDYLYQAVTGKFGATDDELFKGPYFWFEIEWKPTEIIWRVGPEKDKMKEIGYVDQNVSAIPNNQMLLVITQEWHLANWWPEAPFDQNRIPFPKKDIVGEVLDIEIE